jgi:ComEC/Rec2-related protein
MKRILNPRPFFVILTAFACGIFLGFFLKTSSVLFFVAVAILGGFLIFLVVVKFLKTKNALLLVFKKYILTAFAALIFVGLGFGAFSIEVFRQDKNDIFEYAIVGGTVTDKIETTDFGVTTFYIKNAVAQTENKKINLSGVVLISYSESDFSADLSAGSRVVIYGIVTTVDIFVADGINSKDYKNNVNYFMSLKRDDSLVAEAGGAGILEAIRIRARDNLYGALGKRDGAVLYALLFGDKSDMSLSVETAFSDSGLMHIFAVSGLHVGFLSMLILWLLTRLKVGKGARFFVVFLFLLLYSALCDFSPSVTRAFIMVMVVELSRIAFRQPDLLSSVSFSAFVILVFRPLYLFDVGFLMTFASVFGIICLMPLLQKAFAKLPKFLRDSLSMSISVQIALLPIMAHYFGKISLFGFILNIFAVPIVAAAFTALFIIIAISLVAPFLSVFLHAPNILIIQLKNLSVFVQSTGIATIIIYSLGLLAVLYYIVMFIGRFVTLKPSAKSAVCITLSLIFTVATLLVNLPDSGKNSLKENSAVVVQDKNYSASIIKNGDGKTFLSLNGSNANILTNIKIIKHDYNLKTIDYLVLTDLNNSAVSAISDYKNIFYIGGIIVPHIDDPSTTVYYQKIEAENIRTVFIATDATAERQIDGVSDVSLFYMCTQYRTLALSVKVAGTYMLFVNDISRSQLNYVSTYLQRTAAIIVLNDSLSAITAEDTLGEAFRDGVFVSGNLFFSAKEFYMRQTYKNYKDYVTILIDDNTIDFR